MKNFYKKPTALWSAIGLLVLSLFILWPSQKGNTYIYLLYDGTKAGQRSQVDGVSKSLDTLLSVRPIRKQYDINDKDQLATDIQTHLKKDSKNTGIILTAEVESIAVLKDLKPQHNVVIAHSCHQFTPDHAQLKDIADIVVLPKHVVTPDIQNNLESGHTKLIQTVGVPHSYTPKNVEESYKQASIKLPQSESYVGVILGGDAPTPDKKTQYYTAEEAVKLAAYITPYVKGKAHLLILNGPRTGKHDQKTGKPIASSHRDGKVDFVTTSFVEQLKKEGLEEGKDYTLFDFQFDAPSAYPLVLGTLLVKKGPMYVAGDSTSMISETADCLPKGHVIAYTNGAMNENHRKHCQSEKEAGRDNGQWRLIKATVEDDGTNIPASHIIAEAIVERLHNKLRA